MKNIYPMSRPHIGNEEREAVSAVLKTGHLSLGPKHKEFEEKFAKKIGTKYACSVSSGTAGLHLAMLGAGIGPGDEVITSPFSFVASANCILYVGAKPVFADIDPVTYNLDPSKIEEKITKKTKAILIVHIFGQSADMSSIIRIAKKHRLKIVEDACESICATHKGNNTGTFGESAVFAFYPNKQMTTGEGGMIVTDNKKLHSLFMSLRNQGRAENMQWLDHERLGYNYRIDELSAALGVVQLNKLDYLINQRAGVADLYNKYFSKHADVVQIPIVAADNTHSWFVYVIRIKNPKIKRDRIIEDLQKEGIATKAYLPSIHLFSFYKDKFGFKKGDFPVSELISSTSLALPFYVGLKEKDINHIVNKVISAIDLRHKHGK
ncbi:MAG: polysaccharide biosynthesis protein [Candidatus Yanofskybacteria bacterium RIFCSPHIGHO2_01_FULL_43_42]|uniref:Polysaccharide biosynthesis protein n=1 Tax=Candidatus Yanofskybacteria bacterium RIFCSPLOWO2_01_FULL_43_22 TaxID=1802695 RepID=A0A1F8GGV5_9BACT|nr:MAG: polysaccharide biosynthesis protein [Candidatus Yanofskybacteria bacterium RIFCSPHIGHO2_01_FULL_43_42]OGN13219.1 MAG: polysaccharide biosynthesis protein [Candidatus Yanofskybacteria bacterium RIFCSPHIGHO2_02_FULL_43_17]OGN24635.1 MAG: polysaccharide biosynthesis protein [Candidatus Yanofskybacteria bacterium RIFCSPLOWO2_01_FULL_43_22]